MPETFLFLYEHLKLGGIETNIIEMIKAYHQQGRRIIWLRYGGRNEIFAPWIEVLQECEVEIVEVNISSECWFGHDEIKFISSENVHAVAFSPVDFARLECLANEYPATVFHLHYIVPHFEMQRYYLEDLYCGIRKAKVRRKLSKLYLRWYENGSLSFFGKKHEKEMNQRYAIPCLDDNDNLLKKVALIPDFDEEHAAKMAACRNDKFTIVTCGRFDFPHKGYMFGLIDAVAVLKPAYPQLQLRIVGYGDELNEKKIRSYARDRLGEDSDTCFMGAVSPEKMVDVFHHAHINISVAGGTLDGCKAGVVSLSARHYSYSCEVYGWMSKNNSSVLRDDPGESVVSYIENLIRMDSSEYVEKCRMSYEAIRTQEIDANWLFNRTNVRENYYQVEDIKLMKLISRRMDGIVKRHERVRSFLSTVGMLEWVRKIYKRRASI